MRVTKYRTKLDEDRLPMLVKEEGFNYQGNVIMNSPNSILNFLHQHEDVFYQDVENVWLFCFDTKQKLLGYFLISTGSVNHGICSPREIFIKALAVGACNICLIHNHPSGDPTPSKMDIDVTEKIRNLGEMLEISLIDHMVVGNRNYFSFYESMWQIPTK